MDILENLFGQQDIDDDYFYLLRIIQANLDNHRLCYNCRWRNENFCSTELSYMVEELDFESRSCEFWEKYIPSSLILNNHIQ